jgi:hypothetical protein
VRLSVTGAWKGAPESLAHVLHAERTLAERGRTDNCLVGDQKKNETSQIVYAYPYSYPDKRTEYVYRLKCPAGGPDVMVTTHNAEKGAIVSVRWDPSGRIDPRPAYEVTPAESFQLAVGAGCASAFLVLLDVMIDVRRNLRSP